MAATLHPASLYTQDLRNRRIRLLDLSSAPTPSSSEDALQGNLRIVSLVSRFKTPTFDALSYVWGEDADSPSRCLRCGEVDVPITKNCYDALRILYGRFGVRTIWVDAICIDQGNGEEKEDQIPLMRDVYGGARRVWVWLGGGTRGSDGAMDWIAQKTASDTVLVTTRFKAFPAIMLPSEILRAMRLIPLIIERYRLRWLPPRPYSREAMQDLISRPWFKRMWTVQELVMANEPIAVCGTKSLRWNDLHAGIARFGHTPENRRDEVFMDTLMSTFTTHSFWTDRCTKCMHTEGQSRTWIQGDGLKARAWKRFLHILEWKNMLLCTVQDTLIALIIGSRFFLGLRPLDSYILLFVLITRLITLVIVPRYAETSMWEASFRNKLSTVMNWIRNRDATQPVDKVFALSGLFQDFGIPLQRPDYSKSMAQVYLEFTCSLILWHGRLDLLAESSMPGIQGLPSWVPDWSRRYDRVSRESGRAAGDSVPRFEIVSGAYKGSGLSDPKMDKWKWTPDMTRDNPGDMPKIITKGLVGDKVIFCFPPLLEVNEQHGEREKPSSALIHNTKTLLHYLTITQQPHFHADSSPKSIEENLFQIMHSEVWKFFNHRAQFREIFPGWLALLNTHISSPSSPSPLSSSSVSSCIQDLRANERLFTYHIERCNALAGKRIFFTTEKGRLGTGIEEVKEGDGVALLAGLGYPVVLRKKGKGKYGVVGVGYVVGSMRGEAWSEKGEEVGEVVLV